MNNKESSKKENIAIGLHGEMPTLLDRGLGGFKKNELIVLSLEHDAFKFSALDELAEVYHIWKITSIKFKSKNPFGKRGWQTKTLRRELV